MSADGFWLRSGPTIAFPGLSQDGKSHCVYASVAGAVNHVAGRPHWSVPALVAECDRRSERSPTFDTVVPVAVEPLKDLVSYEIARERLKPRPTGAFVVELSRWVSGGGIAVISLEAADGPLPAGKRLQNYHMITLIAKDGDRFQVWDTNNLAGFLTPEELENGFRYLPLLVHPRPWMIKHPEHDCVLFRNSSPKNQE
jgi:hypothetical protein